MIQIQGRLVAQSGEGLTLGPSSAANLGLVCPSSVQGSTLGVEPTNQLDLGFIQIQNNFS